MIKLLNKLKSEYNNDVLSSESDINEIADGYVLMVRYNENSSMIDITKYINNYLIDNKINDDMKNISQLTDQTSKKQLVTIYFDKIQITHSHSVFYNVLIIFLLFIIYELILYSLQLLNTDVNFYLFSLVYEMKTILTHLIQISKPLLANLNIK